MATEKKELNKEENIKYIFENKVYNKKPDRVNDYMDFEEFIWEDGYTYRNYMEKDWIRLVKLVLNKIWTDLSTKTEKFIKTINIIILIWIIWIFTYMYNITKQINTNTNIKYNIITTKQNKFKKILSWQNTKLTNINTKLNNIDMNTLEHLLYLYKDKINYLYNKKNLWQK